MVLDLVPAWTLGQMEDGGGLCTEDGCNWGSFVAQHTKELEYIVVHLIYSLK